MSAVEAGYGRRAVADIAEVREDGITAGTWPRHAVPPERLAEWEAARPRIEGADVDPPPSGPEVDLAAAVAAVEWPTIECPRCPRCPKETTSEFYGPCAACVAQLRAMNGRSAPKGASPTLTFTATVATTEVDRG